MSDLLFNLKVTILNRQMVHWLTQALVSLVPAHHRLTNEAQEAELKRVVPTDQLRIDVKSLSTSLVDFTGLLTRSEIR
jgi:hypothetical protein